MGDIASKHNTKDSLLGIEGLSVNFQCPFFSHELRTNEYNWGGDARNVKERICDVCSKKKKSMVSVDQKNNC